MAIQALALHRLPAGFADGVFERGDGLLLWRGCAGHVENFFLQDCAVQIVHAVAERNLCERQSQADPISSQVIDVIQVNPQSR